MGDPEPVEPATLKEMKMGKRTSGFSKVFLLAMTLALCLPGTVRAGESLTFVVDGLSGHIYEKPQLPAHAGDAVTVRVVCADLINYEYTIEQTEKVELVEQIQVVGVEGKTRLQGAAPGEGARFRAQAEDVEPESRSNKYLWDKFLETKKNFDTTRSEVEDEIRRVSELSSDLPSKWKPENGSQRTVESCEKWPSELAIFSFDYKDLTMKLDQRAEGIARLQDTLQQVKLWLAGQPAPADGAPAAAAHGFNDPPPTAAFISKLETEVNKLENAVTTLRTKLGTAAALVAYWEQVKTMHPMPVLEQSFLMDQSSSRYVVQVKRRAVSATAKNLEQPNEEGKYSFATLASLPFESHALARFNLTMGIVGVHRPDDRAFSIAPRVGEGDEISYEVIESETSNLNLDAGLFLGIYLGDRVDPFDRKGGAWMAMLGTEFDASPDTFYLGLGYDTKTGIVLGLGLTQYRRTSLTEGWEVGQEVPLKDDGTPKTTTLPTVEDDDVGFYALVGFRPGLFKLWWSARKN